MIPYLLTKSKNSSQALLAAGITAASSIIQLKAGEASLFPSGAKGVATSVGDNITLNATGIGAKVAVGDFIRNLTDGSKAFVTNVTTNSITTTPLDGGADNLWENSDDWVVGSFYAWLSKKDITGEDTTRELILVQYVNLASDQVHVETRAVEGTATVFDADDYLSVYVSAQYLTNVNLAIADLQDRKAEDDEVVHNTGAESIAGVKTFASLPLLPAGNPTGQEAVSKAFLDAFTSSLGADTSTFTAAEAISEDDLFRFGNPSASDTYTGLTSFTTTGTQAELADGEDRVLAFSTSANATNVEKLNLRFRALSNTTATMVAKIYNRVGNSLGTQVGAASHTLTIPITHTSTVTTGTSQFLTTGTEHFYDWNVMNLTPPTAQFLFTTTATALNVEKISFRVRKGLTGSKDFNCVFTLWDSAGTTQIGTASDLVTLNFTGTMALFSDVMLPNLSALTLDPSTDYRIAISITNITSGDSNVRFDGGAPQAINVYTPNLYKIVSLKTTTTHIMQFNNQALTNLVSTNLSPSTNYYLVLTTTTASGSPTFWDGGAVTTLGDYHWKQIYTKTTINRNENANKVYQCDQADTLKRNAIGMATESAVLDDEFTGLYNGATGQLTGLTAGSTYYVGNAGAIATSGTIKVGKAIKSDLFLFSRNTQI